MDMMKYRRNNMYPKTTKQDCANNFMKICIVLMA